MGLKRGDWSQYAVFEAEVPVEENKTDEASDEVNVAELTVAEVEKLVEEGVLTPEEVYEAESKGKGRKTLLAEYDPSN